MIDVTPLDWLGTLKFCVVEIGTEKLNGICAAPKAAAKSANMLFLLVFVAANGNGVCKSDSEIPAGRNPANDTGDAGSVAIVPRLIGMPNTLSEPVTVPPIITVNVPGITDDPPEASAEPDDVNVNPLSVPAKVGVRAKVPMLVLMLMAVELIVSGALTPSLRLALNEFVVCEAPGVMSSYVKLTLPLALFVVMPTSLMLRFAF